MPFGLDPITFVARSILVFAAWVEVPIGLSVAVPTPDAPGAPVARFVRMLWIPTALGLTVALFLPAGPLAMALILPWLATTVGVAVTGLARFLARKEARFDLRELTIDAGLAYLPVGAVWAIVSRSNTDLLGFSGTKALLTANHFHFAGFGACVLVGALGRRELSPPRAWYLAAAGTVAGVALVALGITVSHTIEVVAAWELAASILVVAWLAGRAARRETRTPTRVLLALSSLSGILPAALAIHFSMTGFERLSDEAFHRMVLFHGLINAVGFVGAGLAGLHLARPRSLSASS